MKLIFLTNRLVRQRPLWNGSPSKADVLKIVSLPGLSDRCFQMSACGIQIHSEKFFCLWCPEKSFFFFAKSHFFWPKENLAGGDFFRSDSDSVDHRTFNEATRETRRSKSTSTSSSLKNLLSRRSTLRAIVQLWAGSFRSKNSGRALRFETVSANVGPTSERSCASEQRVKRERKRLFRFVTGIKYL